VDSNLLRKGTKNLKKEAQMRKIGLVMLCLVVVGALALGQESDANALEAKLDGLYVNLHGLHYFLDSSGDENQWLSEIYDRIGNLGRGLSLLEIKVMADLADLGTSTDAIEAKLDDEALFTDDTELATHEANVIVKIDANEAKIDAVEVKLDDETRFTDDAELATHEANVIAEIDANEAKIDAVEVKLDTEARFTDDTELAAAQAALKGEIDENEGKIDIIDTNVDTLLVNLSQHDQDIKQDIVDLTTAMNLRFDTVDAAIVSVEAKLDDGTRFTSDTELAAAQAALKTEIDENEAKIDTIDGVVDGIEVKLDTASRFTDDTELAAAQAALKTEIDANEVKIDSIETKLDGVNGLGAIMGNIDANETKIDTLTTNVATVDGKVDTIVTSVAQLLADVGSVEGKLDIGLDVTVSSRASASDLATLQTDVTNIKSCVQSICNMLNTWDTAANDFTGSCSCP
jgi:hypothetical protein